VGVVDLKGNHKILTPQYLGIEGIAWSPDDKTIMYGESTNGAIQQIDAVTLNGEVRAGSPGVGDATIQDVTSDGRQLIIRTDVFDRLWSKRASDTAAQDLSWLDATFFPILSGDGTLLVFGDASSTSGGNYAVMLRRTDGSPAVRLGEGGDYALSRDGKWVLSGLPSTPVKLMMYPTGAGTARRLDHGEFTSTGAASFFDDDRSVLVCGTEPKHAVRCYTIPLESGSFKAITPDNVNGAVVAPDGKSFVAMTADGYRQFSMSGGAPRPVPGLTLNDNVRRYSPDGRFLWTTARSVSQPVRVDKIDINTGVRSQLIPDFSPLRAGVLDVTSVTLADDPHTYSWIEREMASYLFELRGMK
jgi:eukaryotic-like serine/threonine-protein kinase